MVAPPSGERVLVGGSASSVANGSASNGPSGGAAAGDKDKDKDTGKEAAAHSSGLAHMSGAAGAWADAAAGSGGGCATRPAALRSWRPSP